MVTGPTTETNIRMRELLDDYRNAVDTAEAVELANELAGHSIEQPDALAAMIEIWDVAGHRPDVHRRAAKRIKDNLVKANARLIRVVAKSVLGVASKNPENLTEAMQEGAMGVMRAVDAFDPSRGLWSVCARHWIRYYVQTCVHRQSDFPRQRYQRMPTEVVRQANAIRAKHGREPVPGEMSWKGEPVTPGQWRDWTERAHVSSYERRNHYGDDELDPGNEEFIVDPDTSPDQLLAGQDFTERMRTCIGKMSPRNREILTALFIDGDPPTEVIERFRMPKQRLHELRLILAGRLRKVLGA
jgi:RNA polymerase sigma factor (sigma-70 family)